MSTRVAAQQSPQKHVPRPPILKAVAIGFVVLALALLLYQIGGLLHSDSSRPISNKAPSNPQKTAQHRAIND